MFAVTRIETDMIMSGRATGLLRIGNSFPYKSGDEIIFTSEYLDGSGRPLHFARALVMTVATATVGFFRKEQMIAEVDGYENAEVMILNLSAMYKGVKDSDIASHIKFRLIEIDKQAGLRGNVEDGKNEFQEIDGVVTKITDTE